MRCDGKAPQTSRDLRGLIVIMWRAGLRIQVVINGATCGRHWSPDAARAELRRTAAVAGVRREGVPLIVIQRQLGHSNLGITSVYLQGIDSGEIIETVHARRAPMIPVSVSLRL